MNRDKKRDDLWDFLEDMEIATKEELQLVTNINGYNLESLESVLYVRTGYRYLEQYLECEMQGWKTPYSKQSQLLYY